MNLLPKSLVKKTLRYKRQKGSLAHLFGKLLLMKCLEKIQKDPDLIHSLKYDNYNRPYINSEIDFNISHSGEYAVCAISKNSKIGVDIEKIRPVNLDNFNIIMSENQWKEIHSSSDPIKLFFKYWSIKESVIKASGEAFSIPVDKIVIKKDFAFCCAKKWHLTEFKIDNDYSCFLSCNNIPSEIILEKVFFSK